MAAEGALYELLARGNKDTYFLKNDMTAISPFDNNYNPVPAQIHERRLIPPLNGAEFGRTCEFDFEVAGEVFTDPTLLIQLPSWLPVIQAAQNPTSIVRDVSAVTYGYTNGIAYFLFKNIQIYQDQLLLQEFSGDALFAASRSRGSLNSAFLENKITGTHSGTDIEIARAATPGLLRLRLPLVGCQHPDDGGFPSITARKQTYKLRVTLRKLEDLIEASDGRAKPSPWERTDFTIQTSAAATPTQFTTGLKAPPSLQLETRHIYVGPETRDRLVRSTLEIPFSRLYENTFSFGTFDYAPLANASIALASRRVDATHPAGRMVFWFHTDENLRANKYVAINGPEYYNNISFFIAGRDRETLFSPLVWNTLQHLAKEERDPGPGFGVMSWELGDLRGRIAPYQHQPEGTVNFTTADRPTIYVDLAGQKTTEMRVVVDTYAIAVFGSGRGGLKYAN